MGTSKDVLLFGCSFGFRITKADVLDFAKSTQKGENKMKYAKCIINGLQETVDAQDIANGIIDEHVIQNAICPCCSKPAYLVHPTIKAWHFAARHEPGCDIVNDGNKHKIYRKIVDKNLDVTRALTHVDGPVRRRPKGEKEANNEEGEEETDIDYTIDEIDAIDSIEVNTVSSVSTLRGIVLCLKEFGKEKECGNGLKLLDIFMTQKTAYYYRKHEINKPFVATCVRVSRNNPVCKSLDIPKGYICFMDAYAGNPEKAIYFFIRIQHREQYQRFMELLATFKNGRKENRYKYKYVMLFAEWKRIERGPYHVYQADINSWCYLFTNQKVDEYEYTEAA